MKKVAAIDMGSNAIRLGLATIKSENDYYILDRVRTPIRLGTEAFSAGTFSKKTITEVLKCFHSYKARMEVDGVEEYRIVATSAFRNAENSKELKDIVLAETGLEIEVIGGDQEAEMIRNAVAVKLLLDGKDWLLFDIGGGSVELSIFIKGDFKDSISLPLGTVRLLNSIDAGVSYSKLIGNHGTKLDEFLLKFNNAVKHFRVIGTGGNFRRLLKIKRKVFTEGRGDRIYPDEIQPILRLLESRTLNDRMEKYNLKIDAADVIIPALHLIENVINRTKVKKIYAPEVGLIDALFIEMTK